MIFNINKNRHYCNFTIPRITIKHRLSGLISFKHIDYNIESKFQKDSNKIIGLSNNWHHHKDSIRICWRYNSKLDMIDIMVSCYVNSVRQIHKLSMTTNSSVDSYSIQITDEKYIVKYNYDTIEIDTKKSRSMIHYLLKPYFGGHAVAPKHFRFEISTNFD